MDQAVSFDYFYGGQSDMFSYYRIPRLLITSPHFKTLSTDAKLLYGLLLDRMGLSSRNGWYDGSGRVYKYDILKHPNLRETEDGGAAPYLHSPVCLYGAEDLSFPFVILDSVEIVGASDSHDLEEYHEENT